MLFSESLFVPVRDADADCSQPGNDLLRRAFGNEDGKSEPAPRAEQEVRVVEELADSESDLHSMRRRFGFEKDSLRLVDEIAAQQTVIGFCFEGTVSSLFGFQKATEVCDESRLDPSAAS